MQKKLTITIDEDVYAGLYRVVGRRKISRFIESLVRPHVVDGDRDVGLSGSYAPSGPIFVSDGIRAAHVIMTIEDYLNIAGQQHSIVDLLSVPEISEIDFDPPLLDTELYRKSELF